MKRASLGLLALAFYAAAAAPGNLPNLSNESIVGHFDIVAFGSGEHAAQGFTRVRKWEQPIRIGLQGDYPDYFEQFVNEHIVDLVAATSHPIELYYSFNLQRAGKLAVDFDRRKVNVILYYLPRPEIARQIARYFDNDTAAVEKLVTNSSCFAKFFKKKNNIVAGIVVFPDHLRKVQSRTCVIEELTQLLGLPNDSDRVAPSIFNDKSLYIDLTDHYRLLLRVLYDARMKAGMSRAEALLLARRILDEIRPGQ